MPVGHVGWSPDYGGGKANPERTFGIGPDRPPEKESLPPDRRFAILYSASLVALSALRSGDAGSALRVLEEAFANLGEGGDPSPPPPPPPASPLQPERF